MRWPEKLNKASKTGLLFSTLDIMPSILGIMGLDVPKECQGKNLSKAILTGDENAVDYIPIWMWRITDVPFRKGFRGVITRDYTFSTEQGAKEGSLQNVLFDRQNDPNQLNNLFSNPKMAQVKEKLWQQTQQWMTKYNDNFWESTDFLKAATTDQWNNSPYIRPVDVLKKSNHEQK
jgi:arylsulfatase A-like enzyme